MSFSGSAFSRPDGEMGAQARRASSPGVSVCAKPLTLCVTLGKSLIPLNLSFPISCQDRKSWKRTQGLGAVAGVGVTRGTADQSGHSNLAQEKGNYHLLMPALCREPLPYGSDGKESACKAGDLGLIPGLRTSVEKEMATHSSIPAWRIHGQRSLVGSLGSMGSQRVRHN